jgi:hypothetical protein
MAKRSKPGVLKRQRERKKAEKAAWKREQREERAQRKGAAAGLVATRDDLAGYGLTRDDDSEDEDR